MVPHEEKTFKILMDWQNENIFLNLNVQGRWDSTKTNYLKEDIVRHEEMFFIAKEDMYQSAKPNTYLDGNNPWDPFYPWEDGHFIDIKPTRWFVDGDSWTVNLKNVGKSGDISEDTFEDVNVVPNPYFVHSDFETDPSERKLRFINLPDDCEVSIYTVSGELVDEFSHSNFNISDGVVNSGSEWWNLKNAKGDLIAPGLYIYVVESSGYEYIGKFAVVR
jgi:hypothetical protein